MKVTKFIIAVAGFPFFIGGLLSFIAWVGGRSSDPSYALWVAALLWATFVPTAHSEIEAGAAAVVRSLTFRPKGLVSPIRWRGHYFLCKAGRLVMPVPYEIFKCLEKSLLVASDRTEYVRLSEATHFAPSRETNRYVRELNTLRQLERKLCSAIARHFIENPSAREAVEVFGGGKISEGYKLAVEAIQWIANGEMDAAAFERNDELVLQEIPPENLRMVRFLNDRIIFQYQDHRSIHWMFDTGERLAFDPRSSNRNDGTRK